MSVSTDAVLPFVFESLPIRGALVQIEEAWRRMLLGRDYAAPVRDILGHAAAATALIAQSLKFDGRVTLQLNGDGPLSLLVMQSSNNLELRGMASSEKVHANTAFSELLVNARCAITIDAGAMEQPYQGIVEVSGHSLAASLQNYFTQSAQIPSHLRLLSDQSTCGGILLQQMPERSGPLEDDWRRFGLLATTLGVTDISSGIGSALLGKLFSEDDVRVFGSRPVIFCCRCSEQRAEEVLRLLGEEDTRAACEEQGAVSVTCEYCGKRRRFDAIDIGRIFAARSLGGTDALH